jgi:hypothetical protein
VREWTSRWKKHAPVALLAIATAALARRTIHGVLEKLGHPGAALDDAYIHFQYARAFAEGHPFRFQAGEPISTGATSFAWPIVLSVPWLFGLRGESIMWAAWTISFVALGALAYEAYRLTEPLAGRAAGMGAGAMTLLFGGHVWCAASGMEVVPFAWLVAFSTRRASEWIERDDAARTRRDAWILLGCAIAAPLVRPEGAITSLVLGVAIVSRPVLAQPRWRALGGAFVLAALLPNVLFLLLTGHATSSTAQVKLIAGNPYYSLLDVTIANARTLAFDILNGEKWSVEFLPTGGAPLAFMGIVAIGWRAYASRKWFRAAAILVFALSMFVPCTYVTFLWNRLRYLWPFATPWMIGLACLARSIGDLATLIDARVTTMTSALLSGGFAGALAMRLEWVMEDVSQSASGIGRQQVALGHWADANLPNDARIGVNDTGAIAYFGNRRTFDVVGLTTPTEGRYWVMGAGSRLEHYERLHENAPQLLPTHFIVYPEWMACEPVLGHMLHEAVVTDASILGGQSMRVHEARWEHLGSGARPWTAVKTIHDEVDVADLESEREHGYELLGAHDGEETAAEGNSPSGEIVLDGGRTNRTRDRFVVRAPGAAHLVARVETHATTGLSLRVNGQPVGRAVVEAGPWTEVVFDLPAGAREIEVSSDGAAFTSFHYWVSE